MSGWEQDGMLVISVWPCQPDLLFLSELIHVNTARKDLGAR